MREGERRRRRRMKETTTRRKKHSTKEEESLQHTNAHCNRIYIHRVKDILVLSPRVLGVPTKLLDAQSNTPTLVINSTILGQPFEQLGVQKTRVFLCAPSTIAVTPNTTQFQFCHSIKLIRIVNP